MWVVGQDSPDLICAACAIKIKVAKVLELYLCKVRVKIFMWGA